MKSRSIEVKQTQQFCPTISDVAVLTVKGDVKGNLIEGEVVDCNNYACKISPKTSFCWIRRRILTAMW